MCVFLVTQIGCMYLKELGPTIYNPLFHHHQINKEER